MSSTAGSFSSDSKVMVAVFFVILVAFIGFSVPHIVFGPLFLESSSTLFAKGTPDLLRSFLLGFAIAVFPIGQVISLPILGKFSDIFGRKKVLVITLIVAIFGIALTTFGVIVSSVSAIIVGRFVTGLAEGNIAIAQAIVSDSSNSGAKEKRFAYITVAVNVGFIVGPLLGGLFSKFSFLVFSTYAMPFIFAVLMYIICLVIVIFYIPSKTNKNVLKTKSNESNFSTFKLLTHLNLRNSYFIAFLTNIGVYSMFLFYTVFLVKEFGFGVIGLAIASALLSVPLIVSSLIISKIKISHKNKLLFGCLLLIVGLVMFGFSNSLGYLVVSAIIASFGISFLQVITSLLVSNNAPASCQGQALGVYRAIVVLAEVVIALIGGLVIAFYTPLPFILGAFCCFIVFIFVIARKQL